jgi:hypothetical protein
VFVYTYISSDIVCLTQNYYYYSFWGTSRLDAEDGAGGAMGLRAVQLELVAALASLEEHLDF